MLPDYPLTPTHTWRDTLPPLVDLFEQLAVESPQGVVLMGDSAGGGLAVGVAQLVARRPGPQPTHLVAFAPWVDLTGETPGTEEAAADDPWLTLSKLRLYGTWWGAGDPPAAQASPLHRRPVRAAADAAAVRHPRPAAARRSRALGRAARGGPAPR